MKVKALCGVYYNNKLYKSGDVFDADKAIPNTIPVDKAEERPQANVDVDFDVTPDWDIPEVDTREEPRYKPRGRPRKGGYSNGDDD